MIHYDRAIGEDGRIDADYLYGFADPQRPELGDEPESVTRDDSLSVAGRTGGVVNREATACLHPPTKDGLGCEVPPRGSFADADRSLVAAESREASPVLALLRRRA